VVERTKEGALQKKEVIIRRMKTEIRKKLKERGHHKADEDRNKKEIEGKRSS